MWYFILVTFVVLVLFLNYQPDANANSEFFVSNTKGSYNLGCELDNSCFEPYLVNISVGDTVTWTNNDDAIHVVVNRTANTAQLENSQNGEFFDSGFLLGDGVWEGIRLYEGKLLHFDAHMDRLFNGAELISLAINLNRNELQQAIQKTLDKNQMESDVHIRLIISRGLKKTPYQHPKVTLGDPTIVIIPEYKVADQDVARKGIKLASVETIRDYRVQNPNINSLSKHN